MILNRLLRQRNYFLEVGNDSEWLSCFAPLMVFWLGNFIALILPDCALLFLTDRVTWWGNFSIEEWVLISLML
jgi:hypothetical protein